MKRPASRVTLFAIAIVTVACPPHDDRYVPPIRVAPGVAARMKLISGRLAEVPDASPVAPARVSVMTSADVLGGPNAIGRAGDIMLANDEVAFVIDQVGSSAGFAESGGNLVDAADARLRKDELGQVFTYFGTFPRQGVYETLETGTSPGGGAWALAKGHELYESKLAVTTRYELHAADRAMLLTTTLTNEGTVAIAGLTPGDAIQWGGVEKVAPDRGKSFKGPSSGAFLGGVGRYASYAIASASGDIDAISGPSWSDTIQGRALTLAPGQSMQYARIFLVGPRADASGLVSELSLAAGQPVGRAELSLVDAAGAPVSLAVGARFELSNAAGVVVMDAVASVAGPRLALDLPPGAWGLNYASGGGRGAAGPSATLTILPGELAKASLAVSPAGHLTIGCSERISALAAPVAVPCKATLEGLGATVTPGFGPAHAAGPARNQVTMTREPATVDVAPGRYRITLSRGPEYALTQLEVAVTADGLTEPCVAGACVLRRVLDTAGYLATDFHQHTMLGVDAPTSARDRVIANAAEAVEVAVASEHNVVVDLSPIVQQLGLATDLVSIAGDELTTDSSRKPWGHANVFPMKFDPSKPRGGAPRVRDRLAREVFDEVRGGGPVVVQINHPRSGLTGYFDQLGFDRATGVGTEPGYDAGFDALEVWNGRNVRARDRVIEDFLALLATGHPVTATADTDTHGVVTEEAGYPRTFVRVRDDAHLGAWDARSSAELVAAVREGRDVVLTNGPFLRVSVDGSTGIGGVARVKKNAVTLRVEVSCAPWVSVETLQVRRARGPKAGRGTEVTQRLDFKPNAAGALVATAQLTLLVDRDDALFVAVRGRQPMTPVLSRNAGGSDDELTAFAMTGAIWLDADGDGRALGRSR